MVANLLWQSLVAEWRRGGMQIRKSWFESRSGIHGCRLLTCFRDVAPNVFAESCMPGERRRRPPASTLS